MSHQGFLFFICLAALTASSIAFPLDAQSKDMNDDRLVKRLSCACGSKGGDYWIMRNQCPEGANYSDKCDKTMGICCYY
uniref:mRNA n=1 Tax=Oulactis sp. TaxID=2093647 RepID=A0A4D8Y621_OULSP|nr:mRNA [Oulactis sp. MM-2018]